MFNPHDPQVLRRAVEAEAHRLGFDLFGVTTPDPPPHLAMFETWLERGHHGSMVYLATERARERRADPRRILPECRSIIVVGWRYAPPANAPGPESPAYGRIAAYARGKDYHDILPGKLEQLAAFIEAHVGRSVAHRSYTDTGPLLERDLAQRGGLGWIGKNTCLINPRLGSYLLLAELLLDVELESDPAFVADRCGSCTRCLDACPTSCILPDRTLDARRCISYLTIELKTSIPPELRPQIGGWMFGCDVCQQVCPWNARAARGEAHAGQTPGDADRPVLAASDPAAELALSAEAFNLKYKGSPLRRAKRRGYLRNAAVALGNIGGWQAIPAAAQALQNDPEPLVRGHAAWALGNLGGDLAFNLLKGALPGEFDLGVQTEIRLALEAVQSAPFRPEADR